MLNIQKTIINYLNQTIRLSNCNNFIIFINIIVRRNSCLKRTIRVKNNVVILFKSTILISMSYYDKLSNDRDILFESRYVKMFDNNNEMFAHIVNSTLQHVMIRNVTFNDVYFSKRIKLNLIIEYNQQKYYNFILNANFLIIDN